MPLDLASSAKGNVFGWTHIEKFGKQHNPRREALIIPGHNLMEIRSIEANEPLRIAFDSRGERIFTASHEGAVEIWNIAMGKREQVLGQVPQLPSGIALNTDNSLVAVHVSGRSKDGKGSMTLLRVNGSDAPVVLPTYGKVRQFAFAPTTNTLYFSTDAGSCKHGGTGVFALETGQTDPKEVSLAPVSNVIDFAMHPSGNLIASAGQSRLEPCTGQSVVSVWDVKTNQILHTFLPYQPGAVS